MSMKINRKFWLWLYHKGWYKAVIVSDGVTDNRRALQTLLDAGESLYDHAGVGKIYIKGTIYLNTK